MSSGLSRDADDGVNDVVAVLARGETTNNDEDVLAPALAEPADWGSVLDTGDNSDELAAAVGAARFVGMAAVTVFGARRVKLKGLAIEGPNVIGVGSDINELDAG